LEAIEHVKKIKPNMVLLDLTMPEMNGLEVARVIRDESPETDVLIFTMHFSEDVAREVLRCGARGYVLKSDADVELLAAIRHVQQHKPFFSGRLAMSMVNSFVNETRQGSSRTEHPLPGCALTARELEIVRLLATGKISKEVAAAVGISTRTVESHRSNIMKKMNFASFSELMRFAIRNRLVEP
ncbi:MAG: response regulator transcription factor, partial [Candidatus Acidiferrales bacterium]